MPRRARDATKEAGSSARDRGSGRQCIPTTSRPCARAACAGSGSSRSSSTSCTSRPGRAVRGLGRCARRAHAQGKVRHRALERHRGAAAPAGPGRVPIVSVQNRYNVSDRRSDDVLGACRRETRLPAMRRSSISTATVREESRASPRRSAPGGARVAARTVADDAADPGHRIGRPLEENVAAAAIELSDDDVAVLSAAA